jgi:hypothetical protein
LETIFVRENHTISEEINDLASIKLTLGDYINDAMLGYMAVIYEPTQNKICEDV